MNIKLSSASRQVNRWPDRWHGALTVLATARSSALQLDEVLVSGLTRRGEGLFSD